MARRAAEPSTIPVGKTANFGQREIECRKTCKAMAQLFDHRIVNFVGQQSNVRGHSGSGTDRIGRGKSGLTALPSEPRRPNRIQTATSLRDLSTNSKPVLRPKLRC